MLNAKYQGPGPSDFRGDVVYSKLLTTHDGRRMTHVARRTTDDGHWPMATAFGSGELKT